MLERKIKQETGLSLNLTICRGRIAPLFADLGRSKISFVVWLLCFSDLQSEPQDLPLGVYYSCCTILPVTADSPNYMSLSSEFV